MKVLNYRDKYWYRVNFFSISLKKRRIKYFLVLGTMNMTYSEDIALNRTGSFACISIADKEFMTCPIEDPQPRWNAQFQLSVVILRVLLVNSNKVFLANPCEILILSKFMYGTTWGRMGIRYRDPLSQQYGGSF